MGFSSNSCKVSAWMMMTMISVRKEKSENVCVNVYEIQNMVQFGFCVLCGKFIFIFINLRSFPCCLETMRDRLHIYPYSMSFISHLVADVDILTL